MEQRSFYSRELAGRLRPRLRLLRSVSSILNRTLHRSTLPTWRHRVLRRCFKGQVLYYRRERPRPVLHSKGRNQQSPDNARHQKPPINVFQFARSGIRKGCAFNTWCLRKYCRSHTEGRMHIVGDLTQSVRDVKAARQLI